MAASNNPFYIEPANAMQALMSGVQGYDTAQKRMKEADMLAGRQAAMSALQGGGDLRDPLAKLIGIGDVQGAQAIGQFANQQAQQEQARANLAETTRSHKANEAVAAGELALKRDQPVTVPFGAGLYKKTGEPLVAPSSDLLLDEPTIDFMARQYMAGDTSVLQNLGRGAQGAENVVRLRKRVAELNSGQGQGGADQAIRNAEYFGTKAGQRTLGTKQANIELAATEFEQVLPVVQKASQAVSRTNYPDLNRIIQAFEQKTGDPNIVAFGGAVNTLVNLYARAISPSGSPTVHDKEHAREILTKAWSQGQFDAAVGMMKAEIQAALQSPEKVRDEMRKRFLGGQGPSRTETPTAPSAPSVPPPPPGFNLVR